MDEGIMKVLEEDVHRLWKFHREQHKLEKPSLAGHLALLKLYSLHLLFYLLKIIAVQFEVIFLAQN
jgi:hypothetical protein